MIQKICEYGCGQPAKYSPRKGLRKWCCSTHFTKCAASREKISFEFINSFFEDYGFKLLENKYINQITKMKTICSNGHIHSFTWDSFFYSRNTKCPYCSGFKKDQKDTIKFLNNQDFELISGIHVNCDSKLELKCSKYHKFILSDCRGFDKDRIIICPICKRTKRRRKFFLKIKKFIEDKKYTLLTNEYINNEIKLEIKCDDGHLFNMCWNEFRRGNRCPTCKYEKSSISRMGSGNPNWRGGSSTRGYCPLWETKEFKDFIKDRDGHKCLNPYCFKTNFNLTIHHIDYNKKNCVQYNLITLCNSCNGRANGDRKWHTEWYRIIVNRRYKFNSNQ